MSKAAYLVETEAGNKGIIKSSDPEIRGKLILYLQDNIGNPQLDANKKQVTMLISRYKVKRILAYIN
jgi:hypothetical protein